MEKLKEMRRYHEGFSSKEIHIRLDLFDPHVYLDIKTKYEKYLEMMYFYFPYMLKSQFYQLYGKSKNTNISVVNDLIHMKLIKEVPIAGNHYILPLSRMSQYFEQKKSPTRFKVKPSFHTLLDHFMRAELFVKKGILVHPSPNRFFGTIDSHIIENFKANKEKKELAEQQIQALEQEINSFYENGSEFNKEKLREVGLQGLNVLIERKEELWNQKQQYQSLLTAFEELQNQLMVMLSQFEPLTVDKKALELLAIDWKNKKGFNKTIYPVNRREEQHEFIRKCLDTLPDRSCYFKNIIKNKEQFHLDLVIIHYDDTTKKRYMDLLDDVSRICSCFSKGTFSIQLLTEGEFEKERAITLIKEALNDRLERNVNEDYLQFMKKNYCSKYTVTNTNVQRYLFKHNIGDSIVDDTDFSELETVLKQLG